jgi:hypothetical protein
MFYSSMRNTSFTSLTADEADVTARQARTDIELLQHDIDRLLLITEALWTLAKQEHGYADDVLPKLIEDIEQRRMQAAIAAGGLAPKSPPQPCPACGRINTAGRAFCIFWGKRVMTNPFSH